MWRDKKQKEKEEDKGKVDSGLLAELPLPAEVKNKNEVPNLSMCTHLLSHLNEALLIN